VFKNIPGMAIVTTMYAESRIPWLFSDEATVYAAPSGWPTLKNTEFTSVTPCIYVRVVQQTTTANFRPFGL
jgi:hypothetical protein